MNIDKLVKCFEKEIKFFEFFVNTAKAEVKDNNEEEKIHLFIYTEDIMHEGTFTYKQAFNSELDEETFAFVIFQKFVEKTMELMLSNMIESEEE